MVITSPLTVDDLVAWQCRENDPHAANPLVWYAVANYVQLGNALLFQDENKVPLCAAGIMKEGDKKAGVWFITAPEFETNVKSCIRSLRRMIIFFRDYLKVEEVYTLIDPEWPQAIKFAKLVGFAYDHKLENCIFGENYHEYHFCRQGDSVTSFLKTVGKVATFVPRSGAKLLFPKSKGPTEAQIAAQTEQRKIEAQRSAEILTEGGERRTGRAAGRAGRQLLSFNPLLGSETTLG